MTEVTEQDDKLLSRIVDLTRLHEQDSQIIEGNRATITRLELEIKGHEYNELQLQRCSNELARLEKELGR